MSSARLVLATVAALCAVAVVALGASFGFGPRAALAADPDSRFYRLLQTGLEEVLA